MKIAATSDTHGLRIDYPQADVFIHAGDMSAWGHWHEIRNEIALALVRGAKHQALIPQYKHTVWVPGNHDWDLQLHPGAFEDLRAHDRVHILIDQAWEYEGLVFYGSPWTPPFMNGAFMAEEVDLERRYHNMPQSVDVLVTHGPPFGILDNGKGSKALREAIEKRNIRYHTFGHIHECGGQFFHDQVVTRTYANVSSLTNKTPADLRPAILFEMSK